MAKKNLNGIRVGSMVRGRLGDKKNTMVEGKVLKINVKGKAVVQHEDRGKLILPLKVLKRIDAKKKKTTKKKASK